MKAIKGFENYFATEDGRIWSSVRGHFLSTDKREGEYQIVQLTGKVTRAVHRLIAETFIPNLDNLPEVNHLNGIKSDNRARNLEWSTASNNQLHAYSLKPNRKVGSNHHTAKLNEDLVEEIMRLKKTGKTSKEILELYPILKAASLSCALNGHRWCHVTYKYDVTPRKWPKHLPFPEGVDTINWKRG